MLILLICCVGLLNGIQIDNQFLEQPKDIETILGSTIILRCRTQPIHPSQVTWCKNDFCTLGKTRDLPFYPRYEIIGDANEGEHHFQIQNVSLDDIGMYQCQIRAGPKRAGSMSRKAKLTILQIPTNLSIDNPVVLIENVESFVICRSTNGMPEAKLTWNYPESIKTLSKVDYALISDESLRNSISNLSLIANESHDGQSIECEAHSSAIETLNRTLVTNQTIRIHFQPKVKLIFNGNENENSNVTIRCQIESRPDVYRIEWFNGTHSLHRTNQTQINFILTRFMHRNLLVCQATNQIGTTNQSIQLNVNYRPVFVENSSVILVDEGESAKLECLVDCYPRAQISWIFRNKLLIENVESVLINKIHSKKHVGYYICQANHSIFGLFNRTIRVALKTPPEMIEENEIYSGYVQQSISLVCRVSKDLPLQNLFWSRQDQTNIVSNHKYRINRNESKDFLQSELIIENLSMKDQGIYLCTATNQFGSSIHQIQLKIVHLKYFFFRNLFFYGSISLAILLMCVFISFIFINYSKQHHRQLTKKSSLTDPTNSSFHKQFTQIDDSEDHLFEDDFISYQTQSRRFSTVV